MYHIFIRSSIDGQLFSGGFHVLAVVDSATVNIKVHVSFWILIFSGYTPRSRMAGLYGYSSFLRNLPTVFHSGSGDRREERNLEIWGWKRGNKLERLFQSIFSLCLRQILPPPGISHLKSLKLHIYGNVYLCTYEWEFSLKVKRFSHCLSFDIKLKRRVCGNHATVKRDFFHFVLKNIMYILKINTSWTISISSIIEVQS